MLGDDELHEHLAVDVRCPKLLGVYGLVHDANLCRLVHLEIEERLVGVGAVLLGADCADALTAKSDAAKTNAMERRSVVIVT